MTLPTLLLLPVALATGPALDLALEGVGPTGLPIPAAPAAEGGGPVGIINGEDAAEGDYPQAGGMILDATITIPGYGSQAITALICSSTLIAPDVVLLAAHCLDDYALTYGYGEVEDKRVYWTRQADLSDLDGTRRNPELPDDAIEAWDWVMHEGFDLRRMQTGIAENDDIALLFLDEPVLDISPAVLPTADEGAALSVGDELIVVGWGQQVATGFNERPPAGTYAIKQMGTSWLAELGEFELQVGLEEDDVRKCHGDSGGPSFQVTGDGYLRVVGVTSHAYDSTDCDRKGGVDTRVDAYLTWIEDEMVRRCEDGTRSWCEQPGLLNAGWDAPEEDPLADGDADDGDEEEAGGCACTTGGAAPSGLLAVGLGLVGMARRRE